MSKIGVLKNWSPILEHLLAVGSADIAISIALLTAWNKFIRAVSPSEEGTVSGTYVKWAEYCLVIGSNTVHALGFFSKFPPKSPCESLETFCFVDLLRICRVSTLLLVH